MWPGRRDLQPVQQVGGCHLQSGLQFSERDRLQTGRHGQKVCANRDCALQVIGKWNGQPEKVLLRRLVLAAVRPEQRGWQVNTNQWTEP